MQTTAPSNADNASHDTTFAYFINDILAGVGPAETLLDVFGSDTIPNLTTSSNATRDYIHNWRKAFLLGTKSQGRLFPQQFDFDLVVRTPLRLPNLPIVAPAGGADLAFVFASEAGHMSIGGQIVPGSTFIIHVPLVPDAHRLSPYQAPPILSHFMQDPNEYPMFSINQRLMAWEIEAQQRRLAAARARVIASRPAETRPSSSDQPASQSSHDERVAHPLTVAATPKIVQVGLVTQEATSDLSDMTDSDDDKGHTVGEEAPQLRAMHAESESNDSSALPIAATSGVTVIQNNLPEGKPPSAFQLAPSRILSPEPKATSSLSPPADPRRKTRWNPYYNLRSVAAQHGHNGASRTPTPFPNPSTIPVTPVRPRRKVNLCYRSHSVN